MTTSRRAIVLQARLGSTRLPGKVLATLGDRPILDHCVRRLSQSGLPVIVATTTCAEDAAVERVARDLGVEVFRGSAADVLGRYIETGRAFELDEIVRATADNPFVDIDAPLRTLSFRDDVSVDHVVECGLPVGAAVEAVSLDALVRASALVSDPYDREHVTSFIRRDSRFRALRAVGPGHLRRPRLRLTVDTPEDLAFARDVHALLPGDAGLADLAAIIQAADRVATRSLPLTRAQRGA